MPRRYCKTCGADAPLGGNGRQFCAACRPAPAPCHGCREPASGKQRARIGGGLEGYFCAACLPLAREAARLRSRRNSRRRGRLMAWVADWRAA